MADCLEDWEDADQKPCSEFERRQFEASQVRNIHESCKKERKKTRCVGVFNLFVSARMATEMVL
jgi:hypothetical protein